MFVGHYKSVNSPEEFFSNKRSSLDFPAQVEKSGKRYTLIKTYQVFSESKYNELLEMAKNNSIKTNIEV